MNGTLGRDRLWNQQIWSDIDKAVREEVGRIRVAQKVFSSRVVNNVLPVSTNRIVPFGPGAVPPMPPAPIADQFQPLLEISMDFVLTQAQVDGEENVQLATSRARSAASAIANAEDMLLFFGPAQIAAVLANGVNVTNQPAALPPGFVAEAANYPPFTPVAGPDPGVLGDILGAVAVGKAALTGRVQADPYALFLSPARYAQAFAQPGPGFEPPAEQLDRVVTRGFYAVNSLALIPPPNDIGILVALGGEPTTIILGTDATTAFTFTDVQGYHFRVFERIQMVVRDGRAFQTLTFFP